MARRPCAPLSLCAWPAQGTAAGQSLPLRSCVCKVTPPMRLAAARPIAAAGQSRRARPRPLPPALCNRTHASLALCTLPPQGTAASAARALSVPTARLGGRRSRSALQTQCEIGAACLCTLVASREWPRGAVLVKSKLMCLRLPLRWLQNKGYVRRGRAGHTDPLCPVGSCAQKPSSGTYRTDAMTACGRCVR